MRRVLTMIALSFASLAQTVSAGPLSPVTNDAPIVRSTPTAIRVRPDTTNATFPATLLLCSTANCIQNDCAHFDLIHLVNLDGVCVTGNFHIVAAQIVQPSNSGLPFEVAVGTAGCENRVLVPVNDCVNLPSNEVFTTFEALN
ncbi:hypothetical protein C8Q79DRAFT_1119561 [Trametes meyenii]|nr:hypothetical protein C8Q79DRAFT_1119561 [Trametes meyenii]